MYERKFTLKHLIKNFPNMRDANGIMGQTEQHFGVLWRLGYEKNNNHLRIKLLCKKDEDQQNPWTIDVTFDFSVGSLPRGPTFCCRYNKEMGFGTEGVDFNDIVKNHMTDKSVLIVCHATITQMSGIVPKRKISFDEPKKNQSNVVQLKIGEKKFNVCKYLLSNFSPCFENLFLESATRKVFELGNVDPEVFQNLLDILHIKSGVVKAENIENLLVLADRFQVTVVREKCEKFLMRSDGIDKKWKMRMADEYNLEQVKEDCLKAIGSLDQLKEFATDVADLSHSTLVAVVKKFMNESK